MSWNCCIAGDRIPLPTARNDAQNYGCPACQGSFFLFGTAETVLIIVLRADGATVIAETIRNVVSRMGHASICAESIGIVVSRSRNTSIRAETIRNVVSRMGYASISC